MTCGPEARADVGNPSTTTANVTDNGRRGKPYTEIGADMSGRRRRDDGWDGGHRDAHDDRRDPWADSSADKWGAMDPESAHEPGWTGSAVDAARSNASDAGRRAGSYEPARNAGGRYAAGPGYGGQRERGAAGGHSARGYSGNGYPDPGYGRAGNGGSRRDAAGYGAAPGGQWNGPGYGGIGRPGGSAQAPEFTPAGNVDLAEDGPAGTPRPYGRLSIYTLHEDKTREFDRLAERAAEGVRAAEPDTLVYVIHVVPKAPMQRIIYEIYRDRAAFLSHERQPHIRQFTADRASCVLATNNIDLRLKYAKVAAFGPAAESPMPSPASRPPRTPEPAVGGDRYQSAAAQYQPTQYSAAPQAGATFTPAKDQYADIGQPTIGREAYRPTNQAGAGYANGAGSYQSPNGYSAGNGYSNGASDQHVSGYDAAGGPGSNGAESNGLQYTPRYRELTSGSPPGPASQENVSRYPDGRQSDQSPQPEWSPRPRDQR
jgi:quinol monooxygenase YgiN